VFKQTRRKMRSIAELVAAVLAVASVGCSAHAGQGPQRGVPGHKRCHHPESRSNSGNASGGAVFTYTTAVSKLIKLLMLVCSSSSAIWIGTVARPSGFALRSAASNPYANDGPEATTQIETKVQSELGKRPATSARWERRGRIGRSFEHGRERSAGPPRNGHKPARTTSSAGVVSAC